MTGDATAEANELINAIVADFPGHLAGTRPIHAPGIAASGWFNATPIASSFSHAEHLAGGRVPVTVRFSNGTGDAHAGDGEPLVRGMATRFHLGDLSTDQWGVLRGTRDTDLIAMSLPVFMAEDEPSFKRFLAASVPTTAESGSWWKKLVSKLRLDTPAPPAPAGTTTAVQHLFEFASHYPPACPAMAYLAADFVPESYTTCAYHVVHSYGLSGPGGTRWARLHWEPVDGVRALPKDDSGHLQTPPGNFLRDGLAERIASGHAQFVLRAQLAEEGDDIANPTRALPTTRPRVVLGQLRLTEVVADQERGGEQLAFHPAMDVPGITLPADPILALRQQVYPVSATRRGSPDGVATGSER